MLDVTKMYHAKLSTGAKSEGDTKQSQRTIWSVGEQATTAHALSPYQIQSQTAAECWMVMLGNLQVVDGNNTLVGITGLLTNVWAE